MRYLGYTSLEQVDRLTIPEYELLMEGVQLRLVDQDYRNHLQAFLGLQVRAEKKTGKNKRKPVYRTFRDFYDYEKEINKILKPHTDNRFADVSRFLKRKEEQEDE